MGFNEADLHLLIAHFEYDLGLSNGPKTLPRVYRNFMTALAAISILRSEALN